MQFNVHTRGSLYIAELAASEQVIGTLDDATDVMGEAYHAGAEALILHQHQLHPDFFELKTRLAGEILQKFSNYRMKLAIVGDFSDVKSKSLHDFIYESNEGRLIRFVESVEAAIEKL